MNSPPQATKGRRKDEAKRAAILEAARTLFLANPYDRVSIDAIAAEAGASKVTVYSHFPGGKQDVFVAAISAGCPNVFDAAFIEMDNGADLEGALARLGAAFVEMITSDEVAAMHGVLVAEGARDPSLPGLFYEQVVRRSTLELADRLAREAARGTIACPDPALAAEQFLALVQGSIVYRMQLGLGRTSAQDIENYVRASAALFMRALRPA